MYLDAITPERALVGYGAVGWRGDLGYEKKRVAVRGAGFHHAISTHPPAHLLFRLDGRFHTFRCRVALNDDVPSGRSHADFSVLADGGEVASAPFVEAGAPRDVCAPVSGAQLLELRVRTNRMEFAHAVWLDPELEEGPGAPAEPLVDCLARAEISSQFVPPFADRCIATVTSPSFAAMTDDLLGSLLANSGCQDVLLVLFAIDSDEACRRVAAKYGAVLVPCRPRAPVNSMSKAILYSAARFINARRFLLLDADILVTGDLRPVFSAIDALAEKSILVCRNGNGRCPMDLRHAFQVDYGGTERDLDMLEITPEEGDYPLVVNDGVFAGGRTALLALDAAIRAMPRAREWISGLRNQFIFNLALARLRCAVELDDVYNLQLHAQSVSLVDDGARIHAEWQGREVRLLHFSGGTKKHHPAIRGLYARAPVLSRCGSGDSYALFLEALRAWLGRRGLPALTWSFYGTADARLANVKDSSVFPLLAALHYLIRANGCARVLETGTARGVSAACLASAVAHRAAAAVVTFDPCPHRERLELWNSLPAPFRQVIEERTCGSLEGLQAALAAGERFEAALLDSLHTEEHVWAEFDVARQVVCDGGLILIHDARYALGTVPSALRRIEAAGYPVVRLWCAESGTVEDDHLGLALIENRRPERESAT